MKLLVRTVQQLLQIPAIIYLSRSTQNGSSRLCAVELSREKGQKAKRVRGAVDVHSVVFVLWRDDSRMRHWISLRPQ